MNTQSPVFNVTVESFQEDVVDRSKSLPVVLLFWADQVAPSVAARDTLTTIVNASAGKIWLGLVDVAGDQTLAQQLRVQGLPSVRVIKAGQIAAQLDGPQEDNVYRDLITELTLSSTDLLKEDLASCLEQGDYPHALEILKASIEEEPNNPAFKVEYADVLILAGELEPAAQILKSVPEDTAEIARPTTRLEIANEVADALAANGQTTESLEQELQEDDKNLGIRQRLSLCYADAGMYEQALDQAMAVLLQDREFEEDIGRLTMLRIFHLMGRNSSLATRYRRQMFNAMH